MSLLLNDEAPPIVGPAYTPAGRKVYGTGKLLVGLRAGEQETPRGLDWNKPAPVLSADAERLQQALLDEASRDWLDHPAAWLVGAVVLLGTIVLSARFPWGWFA